MRASLMVWFRYWTSRLFPERHIYVRAGGDITSHILSPRRQMMMAASVALLCGWLGISTVAMVVDVFADSASEREVARTQSKYERWIADRQARLDSAVAQLAQRRDSSAEMSETIEKRHQALAMLFSEISAAEGKSPATITSLASLASPAAKLAAVRRDQDRLVDLAENSAKTRADRLRAAIRLAGLDPSGFTSGAGALGGPLIEAKDPRALAAILDVDEGFARRVQNVARDVSDADALKEAAKSLPFNRPAMVSEQSSSYGVRLDPFTHKPAFHAGLDFPGPYSTPILATAPGRVSFTGVRSGYGNTIEIDHGRGMKTRFAHLSGIAVRMGQQVAVGQRIGAMGSTGRSTGSHLHYEIWVNGRAQNPNRFLRANDYVQ
jgi:murein DD-endopeptidase MepM/ murein hydrolase activator NlpD